jgi:hypothetical protein
MLSRLSVQVEWGQSKLLKAGARIILRIKKPKTRKMSRLVFCLVLGHENDYQSSPSDAVAVVFLFVWCFGILHRLRRLCVLQLKKLLLYLISPVKLNFFLQGCRSNPTNCLNKKINPPSSSLHSWWAVVQMTSDWQKLRGYQRRTYVHTHHSGCDTSAWNQSLFQSQKFSDK